MKKIYWRPGKVSRRIHLFIALVAALGLFGVETLKTKSQQDYFKEKMRAARVMREGMNAVRDYRVANLGALDLEVDPQGSGMIGGLISPITSNTGSLEAKQTTVNPNWAAVMVHLIKRAGVKKGDTIAVGFSGSFPSLNIAVLAAAQALELKVVAISSASASMWGANEPKLTWLRMEQILREKHILPYRSVAASLGGQGDRGQGLTKEGRALLREAVEAAGIPLIYAANAQENLDLRMERFQEAAGDMPISLYVNVGGGTISVGTAVGKKLFRPGLNRSAPAKALEIDSVMARFARQGVPIIHLTQVAQLAKRYGLPVQPNRAPVIGEGKIFYREEYNLWLAGGVLLVIIAMLMAFIRMDFGHRLFHSGVKAQAPKAPERMV